MAFTPADPAFEDRTRASFARQGVMAFLGATLESGRTLTVCRLDAWVEKASRRTHCATGMQTLMCLVGHSGVQD